MINANELRIGNWVKINGHEIKLAKELFCLLLMDQVAAPYPIQLTPEILEKCGFEMHNDRGLWRLNNFYLHFYTLSDNEYCFKYNDFRSSSIFYLHQLQNLYFALTGEELTYQQ